MRHFHRTHTAVAAFVTVVLALSSTSFAVGAPRSTWRDPAGRTTLKSKTLDATFQSGLLIELKNSVTGQTLVSISPDQLPSKLPLFGPKVPIDLDACKVTQKPDDHSLSATFRSPDGVKWELAWRFDPSGDLVLRTSANSSKAVGEMRLLLFGCDMHDHNIISVSNVGIGELANGLTLRGDPEKDAYSELYVHPLILLFQGKQSGWVVEGRDLKIGPANVFVRGVGETATVGFVRGLPVPTKAPEMFEIRFRAYQDGGWHSAVDPYIEWMQHDLGYVPLEQQTPSWVKDIKVNSWVLCGDYDSLEALAKVLVPSKTLLSRNNGYRHYPVDIGYPDYRLTDGAKAWVKRAKELGFRVGIWVNTTGVDSDVHPKLAERFRPGFKVIGHDANGKEQYWNIPGRQIYGSAAFKPWRDYLVEQLKDAADAGVDCVHLDEANTPTGKFLIGDTTAIEGVMLLEKAIKEAYPQMAIETEEFNPMCSRSASFCFSEFDDGHQLGGYIFHRFIKFIPEGFLAAPMQPEYMDANERWGFFMPVADVKWTRSWLPIARAFQDFDLVAAPRAQLKPGQLSAYTGTGGTVASFEKEPTRQGLVLYEPGKEPKWIGARHFGITTWTGPGAVKDWPAYDGQKLIGLDATKSYVFDENLSLPQDHFHITAVPADFVMFNDPYLDIRPGEDSGHDVGPDGSFFRIKVIGHGDLSMFVPDDFLVFMDGKEVPVDRGAKTARIQIDAPADHFTLIWAYRKADVPLVGKCVDLPWQVSPRQREGHFRPKGDDFVAAVTSTGLFIGRFPNAKRIRIQGAYGLLEGSVVDVGDNRGVIRINGKEVSSTLIVGAKRPYPTQTFDVDVSAYAGQHVVLEFLCDGFPHLWAMAKWFAPRIVIEQ